MQPVQLFRGKGPGTVGVFGSVGEGCAVRNIGYGDGQTFRAVRISQVGLNIDVVDSSITGASRRFHTVEGLIIRKGKLARNIFIEGQIILADRTIDNKQLSLARAGFFQLIVAGLDSHCDQFATRIILGHVFFERQVVGIPETGIGAVEILDLDLDDLAAAHIHIHNHVGNIVIHNREQIGFAGTFNFSNANRQSRRIGNGFDIDRGGCRRGGAGGIGHGVIKTGATAEIGIRSKHHIAVHNLDGAADRAIDRRDLQHAAIDIGIVGEQGFGIDDHGDIFDARHRIIHRDRIVIFGIYGQADRRRRGVAIGIGNGIGKAVSAVVVLRRGVSDGAVIVDGNRAVQRLGDAGQLEPAIDGGVVGQHIDHRSGVFVQDRSVVNRDNRVVHRIDRNTDNRRRGVAVGIGDGIGEAIAAVIVGFRGIDEIAIRVHGYHAMLRLGKAIKGQAAIRSHVVGQRINDRGRIFIKARHIGHRHRHVIRRIHGQIDNRRIGAAGAVTDLIGKAVRTGIVGVRRVRHRAVLVDGNRAMIGLGDAVEANGVAIQIRIIAEHIDHRRRIFG